MSLKNMSENVLNIQFYEALVRLILQVPKGKVTTYSRIAEALGDRSAARAVALLIKGERGRWEKIGIPVHRIVDSKGFTDRHSLTMLVNEGISGDENGILDLKDNLFSDFVSDFFLRKLRETQINLSKKVSLMDMFTDFECVAGIDIAYAGNTGVGGCAIHDYENRKLLRTFTVSARVHFPYIPTYLAFRELPLIELIGKELDKSKEYGKKLLMIDGNGILHPLRIGIASHAGVSLNVPTIGVAKTLLCGEMKQSNIRCVKSPHKEEEIFLKGELRGHSLKLADSCKLIYVSPGHGVSFKTALETVIRFKVEGKRLPAPIMEAHKIATCAARKSKTTDYRP